MRVISINNARECPSDDAGEAEFLGYWCTALSPFRGFELLFDGVVADIAWVALRPGLDAEVITWIIEDSGIEHYFDASLIKPGCRSPSMVVLIPKAPIRLLGLYRRGLSGARFLNCPVPGYESYRAWVSIVDGLVNAVGVDELLRHAIRHLMGVNEDEEEGGETKDLMRGLLQAFNSP